MHQVANYFKKRRHLLILGLILAIGLFFRTYQVVERFEFAHDGDLYSWIVKDIIVNKHPRLIGQLTAAPGIFIGPAFYYLLVPFFLLTEMDPIGALIPITFLGLFTIFSYYFILSKLFKEEAGLIGAFLYAILITTVNADRWVVPTVTTSLWAIWYFYSLVMLSRGNFSVLLLLGILVGLIWHIHIALIPTLLAIPVAIIVAKKLPNKRQIAYFFISLLIISLPLLAFEFRHNFSQTLSFINNLSQEHTGESGTPKLFKVLNMIIKNINALYLSPQSLPENLRSIFAILLFLISLSVLYWKKLIAKKELVPLLAWILGVVGFFTVSSTLISEYYFYNIEIILLTFVSLTFYFIYKSSKIGKFLVIGLLISVLIKNLFFYTTTYIYNKGYLERKSVAQFIADDAEKKGFPCVGINYITTPGENVGFRYFFFLKNVRTAVAGRGSPVYSIVIPDEYAKNEVKAKFGHIGVIPPSEIPTEELMKDACSGQNTNLTDPMLEYVE